MVHIVHASLRGLLISRQRTGDAGLYLSPVETSCLLLTSYIETFGLEKDL